MKTSEIIKQASKKGVALGAFNAADVSTCRAIGQAAQKLNTPAIIEASEKETLFFGLKGLRHFVSDLNEELGTHLLLNLDHAKDPQKVRKAIKMGFDLVHFDGSGLPFEENLKTTRSLALEARQMGVVFEGEIDRFPGSSENHLQDDLSSVQTRSPFTPLQLACYFLKETDVDLLAVFVGNVHGLYSTPKRISLDHLALLRRQLTCFFSLHGGSGIPATQIKAALKLGVVKINVNSELRIAYRKALEETLSEKPQAVKLYEIMPPVVEAVQKIVEAKIRLFSGEEN